MGDSPQQGHDDFADKTLKKHVATKVKSVRQCPDVKDAREPWHSKILDANKTTNGAPVHSRPVSKGQEKCEENVCKRSTGIAYFRIKKRKGRQESHRLLQHDNISLQTTHRQDNQCLFIIVQCGMGGNLTETPLSDCRK